MARIDQGKSTARKKTVQRRRRAARRQPIVSSGSRGSGAEPYGRGRGGQQAAPSPAPVRHPAPAVQPGPIRKTEAQRVSDYKREQRQAKRKRVRVAARKEKRQAARQTGSRGSGAAPRGRGQGGRQAPVSRRPTTRPGVQNAQRPYVRQAPIRQPGPTRASEARGIHLQQRIDRQGIAREKATLRDLLRPEIRDSLPKDINTTGLRRVVRAQTKSKTARAGTGIPRQVSAPALKILEQTVRPSRAIAAAAREDVRDIKAGRSPVGSGSLKKAGEGFALKDKSTFQNVLEEAGVKGKGVGAAGFALDVALDPLTYVSGGATTVAAKRAASQAAAKKAAQKATAEAAAKGLSRKAQNRAGRAAASESLGKTRGRASADIRIAGKRVARVKAGRRTQAVGRKVRESGAVQLTGLANPKLRPAGVSRETFEAARTRASKTRAASATGERRAKLAAEGLAKAIKDPEGHDRVINALEELGTAKTKGAREAILKDLPKGERKATEYLERTYRQMNVVEKRARIGATLREDFGYSPRRLAAELDTDATLKTLGKDRGPSTALTAAKHREVRARWKDLTPEQKAKYVTDVPTGFYLRARESGVKVANAAQGRELKRLSKPLRNAAELGPNDAVFLFVGGQMRPTMITGDTLSRLIRQGPKVNQGAGYRVLNQDLVQAVIPERVTPVSKLRAKGTDLGEIWDRQIQGRMKTLLTVPNPQYHLTNLYGDLFNAWEGSNAFTLGRALGTSARVLRQKAKRDAAVRTLDKIADPEGKGIRVGGGKRESFLDLIQDAEEHGAIGQGFIGRDLPEVLARQAHEAQEALGQGSVARHLGPVGRRVGRSGAAHPVQTIRDVGQYREDFVRLASFIGARRRGMSSEEAARHVSDFHFDYGDLTPFERHVLRRIFPFYTFTARNTPRQAKTLVQRPGKFATTEKLRQSLEQAMGDTPLPDDWEARLQDYEQRGVPFPLPGGIPGVSDEKQANLLFPKLPLTDLNRLTTDKKMQQDAIMAMVSPLPKVFWEHNQNYNLFFGDKIDKFGDIEDPYTHKKIHAMKPIPGWLARNVPEPMRKKLGIRPYTKDGKRIWGWSALTDHLVKGTVGPGVGTALQIGTEVRNPRGQTATQRAFGYGTGLKTGPFAEREAAKQEKYDRREYLNAVAESARMNSVPFRAYGPGGQKTPQYIKLRAEITKLEKELGVKRGRPKSVSKEPLTPAEKKELQQVKREAAQTEKLTPAEQDELRRLNAP